ncbi:MAG: peptidase T [Caldisericaceae bacterium]
MKKILENFLDYVSYDTQSDPNSKTFPTTTKQLIFARHLLDELKKTGFECELDKFGYIYGRIPSNVSKKVPVVGFIAHMDTSPDVSGANVKPKVIHDFDGKEIVLNPRMRLSPEQFPCLNDYLHNDIVVTDGTTLLGADDKAGIAEIVEALTQIKDKKHGEVAFAFTPDEEVGGGMDHFDPKKFGADFAYTLDGDRIGGFEYENFNAASVIFTVKGRNIHPGSAKGIMKNAVTIASELIGLFPKSETPETTERYEGFYHFDEIEGSIERVTVKCIIRDFDRDKFESRKLFAKKCVNFINEKYGAKLASVKMKDSYYNMKEVIDKHPEIVKIAEKAYEEAGVKFEPKPIRGGTDGARLSYMGIPTPNIFTGGHNYHSVYEFIPVQPMEKASQVIVNIIKDIAK